MCGCAASRAQAEPKTTGRTTHSYKRHAHTQQHNTNNPPTKTKQNKTKVHKARLDDGREVAVKVQYPGLKAAADADLAVLSFVNALAAKAFPQFNLGWLYKELWRKLREELGAPLRLR